MANKQVFGILSVSSQKINKFNPLNLCLLINLKKQIRSFSSTPANRAVSCLSIKSVVTSY